MREEIIPGVNLLLLFRPEDIQSMYRLEGQFPSRRSHTALEHYRFSKPDIYKTGGLLPTYVVQQKNGKTDYINFDYLSTRNGPDWHNLRIPLQRPLSSPQNVRWYIESIDQISIEFADFIANQTTSEYNDFLNELSRVFVECTCFYWIQKLVFPLLFYVYHYTVIGVVTFDSRLNALNPNISADSCPMKLIRAASDTNDQILRTDNGLQIWRKMKTPAYRKLSRAQEYFEQVALQYVQAKKQNMETKNKLDQEQIKTLLEVYLSTEEIDIKDVVAMVSDMLLAGIDTVSCRDFPSLPKTNDSTCMFAEFVHDVFHLVSSGTKSRKTK